jgi:hypothetical protein
MSDTKQRAREFVQHLRNTFGNEDMFTDQMLACVAVVVYASDEEFDRLRAGVATDEEAYSIIIRTSRDLGLTGTK